MEDIRQVTKHHCERCKDDYELDWDEGLKDMTEKVMKYEKICPTCQVKEEMKEISKDSAINIIQEDIRVLRDSNEHVCSADKNNGHCSCGEYDSVIDRLEVLKGC